MHFVKYIEVEKILKTDIRILMKYYPKFVFISYFELDSLNWIELVEFNQNQSSMTEDYAIVKQPVEYFIKIYNVCDE